jgi:hypothetical protein
MAKTVTSGCVHAFATVVPPPQAAARARAEAEAEAARQAAAAEAERVAAEAARAVLERDVDTAVVAAQELAAQLVQRLAREASASAAEEDVRRQQFARQWAQVTRLPIGNGPRGVVTQVGEFPAAHTRERPRMFPRHHRFQHPGVGFVLVGVAE